MLQESLAGNTKTAIVCCVTADPAYAEQTRSTLQFASRAQFVRTIATVNEVSNNVTTIKGLERELAYMRAERPAAAPDDEALRKQLAVRLAEIENLRAFIASSSGETREQAERAAVRGSSCERAPGVSHSYRVLCCAVGCQYPYGVRCSVLTRAWCPGQAAEAAREAELAQQAAVRSEREQLQAQVCMVSYVHLCV
jgi:hypothetical protein